MASTEKEKQQRKTKKHNEEKELSSSIILVGYWQVREEYEQIIATQGLVCMNFN
jgi:hypothetical protein